MISYQYLKNILEMDFNQMRMVPCAGGFCATAEAIHLFVSNLNDFFDQFTRSPTDEELAQYVYYFNEITSKINQSEYNYYLAKYTAETPEFAEDMASCAVLKSFRDIPRRMQYWAASEGWGDVIRNPELHSKAVKNLEQWAHFIDKPRRNGFFPPNSADGDQNSDDEINRLVL